MINTQEKWLLCNDCGSYGIQPGYENDGCLFCETRDNDDGKKEKECDRCGQTFRTREFIDECDEEDECCECRGSLDDVCEANAEFF